MIAALEEELGFLLLIRDRNGVRLTPEGETLLPNVRELLYAGERCQQLAFKIKGLNIGHVVIGTAYSAFYPILAEIISDFHRVYPDIQVQLISGYSSELLEKLDRHQADICIISKREGKHSWLPILHDDMVAWLPGDHPLAGLSAFPISEFEKEPYIETYPDKDIDNTRVFESCHIRPRLRFSSMDSMATYSMVEAGLGISMNNAINGRRLSGSVCIMPLEPKQRIEIGVASLAEGSPAAGTFLSYMCDHSIMKDLKNHI